jgi:uroporphyrinogen decarboxylase
MAGGQGHVMNLGHGIEAATPEESAKFFVDTVQAWKTTTTKDDAEKP